jgi:hypothetical protein
MGFRACVCLNITQPGCVGTVGSRSLFLALHQTAMLELSIIVVFFFGTSFLSRSIEVIGCPFRTSRQRPFVNWLEGSGLNSFSFERKRVYQF